MSKETSMQRAMREAGLKPPAYRESQQKKGTGFHQTKNVLQNKFLSDALNKKQKITVKSVDKDIWEGNLVAYDDFSIMMQMGAESVLIFKHSIKSITPSI